MKQPLPRGPEIIKEKSGKELSETTTSPHSLEDIVHIANRVGLEYVEAKSRSERLELMRPTQKARAMQKYDDQDTSEVKIKRLAEVDPDYISYLEDLVEAKRQCERLKIRYDSYKNLFEARRSQLSYKKAEMKMI